MKRVLNIFMISLGALSIFLMAEFLPVMVGHWGDSDRNDRIILEENVAAAGKIAYELSQEDKLKLLANTDGALENSCFTKVYETRSRDNLNDYDPEVLKIFEDSLEIMQSMQLLSVSTEYTELETRLTDACCISVDSGQNSIGSLTLWVLTFQEDARKWQFLLDVTAKKLYGMYICDERLGGLMQNTENESEGVQKNLFLYTSWDIDELLLYFEGAVYDGYGIEIRENNSEGEALYIPLKLEHLSQEKEKKYTICFLLGEDEFYRKLSKTVDDLQFIRFCNVEKNDIPEKTETEEMAEEKMMQK